MAGGLEHWGWPMQAAEADPFQLTLRAALLTPGDTLTAACKQACMLPASQSTSTAGGAVAFTPAL